MNYPPSVCTNVPASKSPGWHAASTVFVGNLPWSVTEESMRQWFGEIGEVVAVRIAEDPETGKRKGFGHVEFADPASAQKAVEYNGEELEGRALRIDVSAPRARAFSLPQSPLPSGKSSDVLGIHLRYII
jgi:nucleolin